MFKRTRGYLLLTMLVLTGLAGRLHSDTLSGKERRYLVNELKSSKAAFRESIDGLTARQLAFKTEKNKLSIKEYICQAANLEKALWATAKNALKKPESYLESNFSDAAVSAMFTANANAHQQFIQAEHRKFKKIEEALALYKKERADVLRYAKTTTDDVRNHAVQTSLGVFDAYQLLLLNAIYTKHYVQQIEEIKSSPDFPK